MLADQSTGARDIQHKQAQEKEKLLQTASLAQSVYCKAVEEC